MREKIASTVAGLTHKEAQVAYPMPQQPYYMQPQPPQEPPKSSLAGSVVKGVAGAAALTGAAATAAHLLGAFDGEEKADSGEKKKRKTKGEKTEEALKGMTPAQRQKYLEEVRGGVIPSISESAKKKVKSVVEYPGKKRRESSSRIESAEARAIEENKPVKALAYRALGAPSRVVEGVQHWTGKASKKSPTSRSRSESSLRSRGYFPQVKGAPRGTPLRERSGFAAWLARRQRADLRGEEGVGRLKKYLQEREQRKYRETAERYLKGQLPRQRLALGKMSITKAVKRAVDKVKNKGKSSDFSDWSGYSFLEAVMVLDDDFRKEAELVMQKEAAEDTGPSGAIGLDWITFDRDIPSNVFIGLRGGDRRRSARPPRKRQRVGGKIED